jgi:hypothetical protein
MARLRAIMISQASGVPRDGSYCDAPRQAWRKTSWSTSSASGRLPTMRMTRLKMSWAKQS